MPNRIPAGSNAEVLLVKNDGSLILQLRDDKPNITNPGFVSSFGGHIEENEEPLEAAVREINEETNLNLVASDLEYFGKYEKTQQIHGEDWDVFYYIARNIQEEGLKVFEGQGYVLIHDLQELESIKATILIRQVLKDYFSK